MFCFCLRLLARETYLFSLSRPSVFRACACGCARAKETVEGEEGEKMKRPTRNRMLPSRKRLKRRLVLVSMVVCSGVFGVLYFFSDARQRAGGPGIIERGHGGGGDGSIGPTATILVRGIAHQMGGEGGAEGGEEGEGAHQTTERILSSGSCEGDVNNAGMAVLYVSGVVYCFLGLAIVCDEFFQTSLETISEVLGLTPDVAGATFLAAGSSAPELFTSLADAFGDANSTGTGTIVGSAMFNILVIVALSAAVAGSGGKSIHIDWRPVCRDILFYTYSIAILGLVFMDEIAQWWEGLIMFLSYFIYIVFMKYNSRILAHCQPAKIGITDDHKAAAADVQAAVAAVNEAKRPSLAGGEDTAKVAPLPRDDAVSAAEAGGGAGMGEAGAAAGANISPRKSSMLGVRNRVERKLSRTGSGDENRPLVLADQNQATADEENGGAAEQGAATTGTEKAGAGAAAETPQMEKLEKPGDEEEEENESRFAWPEKLIDQVRQKDKVRCLRVSFSTDNLYVVAW